MGYQLTLTGPWSEDETNKNLGNVAAAVLETGLEV